MSKLIFVLKRKKMFSIKLFFMWQIFTIPERFAFLANLLSFTQYGTCSIDTHSRSLLISVNNLKKVDTALRGEKHDFFVHFVYIVIP